MVFQDKGVVVVVVVGEEVVVNGEEVAIRKYGRTEIANNLDTEKLCDYFSEHLGEYLDVLSALEKLNIAILKALDKTKEEYQSSSQLSQFVTRFLLRETSSQLQSLQGSLECAMEAVEEQSCKGRMDMKKPEALSVQQTGRRCGRRTQKNMCLSPTDPYSGMLTSDFNSCILIAILVIKV
ncbi:UNVERIFIED_CONTAM: hypothetical protein FKN15_038788 [Acipenser sinensis]